MLVMHPSILPKYRGSCPIQHAILNKESETGISIIEISKKKFDAGSILFQSKLPIDEYTTYQDLAQSLSRLGGEGIINVLDNYE